MSKSRRLNESEVSMTPRRSEAFAKYYESRPKEIVTLKRELAILQAEAGLKKPLCLLIAGHNEEEVIGSTIKSAVASGMDKSDIFIVDDNSNDKTSYVAKKILGRNNVIRVKRSGKGLALSKGAKHFRLTKRYSWIHIADTDGVFSPDYFTVFRESLDPNYAAATGYIKSLPGSFIGSYRAFEYTVGMEVHRRFQWLIKTISVIPGPTSCFRSDVFDQVSFANGCITEDFDVTLQLYRKGLGGVQFVPHAIAYTQDPMRFADFIKQITRWNRGILQGIVRHKIGTKFTRIDLYLSYQVLQNLLFVANYLFLVPFVATKIGNPVIYAMAFLTDAVITFLIAALVALRTKRWDAIAAFPLIYILRWVSMAIFMKSFFEVVVLRKYQTAKGTWSNAKGRRYKIA